jgi:hypothetical protein
MEGRLSVFATATVAAVFVGSSRHEDGKGTDYLRMAAHRDGTAASWIVKMTGMVQRDEGNMAWGIKTGRTAVWTQSVNIGVYICVW